MGYLYDNMSRLLYHHYKLILLILSFIIIIVYLYSFLLYYYKYYIGAEKNRLNSNYLLSGDRNIEKELKSFRFHFYYNINGMINDFDIYLKVFNCFFIIIAFFILINHVFMVMDYNESNEIYL